MLPSEHRFIYWASMAFGFAVAFAILNWLFSSPSLAIFLSFFVVLLLVAADIVTIQRGKVKSAINDLGAFKITADVSDDQIQDYLLPLNKLIQSHPFALFSYNEIKDELKIGVLVAKHFGVLSKNVASTIRKDEYGTIVSDGSVVEYQRFFESVVSSKVNCNINTGVRKIHKMHHLLVAETK